MEHVRDALRGSASAWHGVLACSAAGGGALRLAAALVSDLPPLALLGGDAVHYDAMAREPLEPVAPPPWAERIAVPLLVAALPGSTETGFLAVAVASMLAAAVLVGLIIRELGLPAPAQVASAALTGSYVGVHAVYNPYTSTRPRSPSSPSRCSSRCGAGGSR